MHDIRVIVEPCKNKDGTPSKTKKQYRIIDKHRRNITLVGVVHSASEATKLVENRRREVVQAHLVQHPHDFAFRSKHSSSHHQDGS